MSLVEYMHDAFDALCGREWNQNSSKQCASVDIKWDIQKSIFSS